MTKLFDSESISFSGYRLHFPGGLSNLGQVLSSDTAGNLSWVTAERRLSIVSSINALNTGYVDLYTVPVGFRVLITKVNLRLTSTSSVSGFMRVGLAYDSNVDNLIEISRLNNFKALEDVFVLNTLGLTKSVPAGSVVKLNIDKALSGSLAGMSAELFGYFLS